MMMIKILLTNVRVGYIDGYYLGVCSLVSLC